MPPPNPAFATQYKMPPFWTKCGPSPKSRHFSPGYSNPAVSEPRHCRGHFIPDQTLGWHVPWHFSQGIQSNLAILNSVNSKSPLFRSQADSPSIDCHLVLTRLFETLPFRTYFHVPWDFEIAGGGGGGDRLHFILEHRQSETQPLTHPRWHSPIHS